MIIGSANSQEINLIDVTAILLQGLHTFYSDISNKSKIQIIKKFNNFELEPKYLNAWKKTKATLVINKQHSGTCTNKKHSCLRCEFNNYQIQAIFLVDIFFNENEPFEKKKINDYCSFIVFYFLNNILKSIENISSIDIANAFYHWTNQTHTSKKLHQAYVIAKIVGHNAANRFISVVT